MDDIGRYQVAGAIGAGGFATVYDGRDPVLDSRVAIKVLSPEWARDEAVRERFLTEARLLRRIGSPRLVTIYDIGELAGGQPYFVMEYAAGGTLDEWLAARQRAGPLGPAEVGWLVDEIASCLSVVHDADVVHRDVKPSNLLVVGHDRRADASGPPARDGGIRLKLADFGIAKDVAHAGNLATMAGGTVGYMAPEQVGQGGLVDRRADLYAATAVLHYALTGRTLDGFAVASRRPAGWSTLPGPLVAALARGLAIDPAERPADAMAWRAMFQDAIGWPGPAAPTVPTPVLSPPTVLVAPAGPDARAGAGTAGEIPLGAPDAPGGAGTPGGAAPGGVAVPQGWAPDGERADPMTVGASPARADVSPGSSPVARRSSRRTLLVGAAAAVVLGSAGLFALASRGANLGIEGPEQLVAGAAVTLRATGLDDGASPVWRTPDGAELAGSELSVTPVEAGSIEVELRAEHPGGETERTSRRLRVVLPDDAPTIDGPDRLRPGETAAFRAGGADGATFVWNPEAEVVTGPVLEVTAREPGQLELVVEEIRTDGRRVRVRRTVQVS
ncbi:MAG: protein kinase [Acidimicrobiia bacterium]|nr:protein kinase [Acidimicrobiia bacterium]